MKQLKNILENRRKSGKSILPTLEKANAIMTPGMSLMLDDNDAVALIDKKHWGKTFFIENNGLYTLRLGAFHTLERGAMEESALYCVIPGELDYKQKITAMFELPSASVFFFDEVILKAASPFRVELVEGSPMLECHHDRWGFPFNYGSTEKSDGTTIIMWKGFDKSSPNQPKIYFDILRIQIKVSFVD